MPHPSFEDLFVEHGIKPTANRLLVARALNDSLRPLSLAELEERLLTMDRSSIFRVLSLFRNQHLVHVIEGGSEGVRYELCQSHNHSTDDDQHAHFHCEQCHRTFCLEVVSRYRLTIVSVCDNGVTRPPLSASSSKASVPIALAPTILTPTSIPIWPNPPSHYYFSIINYTL